MWVEIYSRWMGVREGALVVWRVYWYNQTGRLDTWCVTNYEIECEETGELVTAPYATFQERIQQKRLIPIGDYTKEEWVEMSKN